MSDIIKNNLSATVDFVLGVITVTQRQTVTIDADGATSEFAKNVNIEITDAEIIAEVKAKIEEGL